MGLSDPVLAAMIGASATLVTASVQLVGAFMKAGPERRSPKSRMRSFGWMLVLMLAAGVGGFAYAEFRAQETRDETRLLRHDLQQQTQLLAASTARLQQIQAAQAARSDAGSSTVGSALAMASLPACRGTAMGFSTQRPACTEQEALQIAVCAAIPAAAQVIAVEPYDRLDDSQVAWAQARATPGQDAQSGRFAEAQFERPDGDNTKMVCRTFSQWHSDKGRTVRMLVRYGSA